MPLPPATLPPRTTDSRSPEPQPADPALCLHACDILLDLGFTSDRIVVFLDGAEYGVDPAPDAVTDPGVANVAAPDAADAACPPPADALAVAGAAAPSR